MIQFEKFYPPKKYPMFCQLLNGSIKLVVPQNLSSAWGMWGSWEWFGGEGRLLSSGFLMPGVGVCREFGLHSTFIIHVESLRVLFLELSKDIEKIKVNLQNCPPCTLCPCPACLDFCILGFRFTKTKCSSIVHWNISGIHAHIFQHRLKRFR